MFFLHVILLQQKSPPSAEKAKWTGLVKMPLFAILPGKQVLFIAPLAAESKVESILPR
jgi:hypothetical protein